MAEQSLEGSVKAGNEEEVKSYLATADRASPDFQALLDSSLFTATVRKKPTIMELLIDAGAQFNQNFQERIGMLPRTFLMNVFALSDIDIVRIFVKHFKGDLRHELVTSDNATVLHTAIQQQSLELVQLACALLKEHGIDLDSTTCRYGDFPVGIAAQYVPPRPLEAASRDTSNGDTNNGDTSNGGTSNGGTSTQESDYDRALRILEYLLELGLAVNSPQGLSPLHFVAASGSWEGAQLLIRYGAQLSVRNSSGEYPWTTAGKEKHYKLMERLIDAEDLTVVGEGGIVSVGTLYFHQACLSGVLPAVRYLHQHKGIDVACLDDNGSTPLMSAAYASEPQVLEYLLQQESTCDVNAVTVDGKSALTLAVVQQYSLCNNVVEQLLAAGADPNVRYDSGCTLLMDSNANARADIRRLLLNYGADVNAVSACGQSAFTTALDNSPEDATSCIRDLLAYNLDTEQPWHSSNVGQPSDSHAGQPSKTHAGQPSKTHAGQPSKTHAGQPCNVHGRPLLQLAYESCNAEVCNMLLDADCSLKGMEHILHYASQVPTGLQHIKQRILEMCAKPYSLKELSRKIILRSLGSGSLAEKILQLYRLMHLPKELANYLGKAFRLSIDDLLEGEPE